MIAPISDDNEGGYTTNSIMFLVARGVALEDCLHNQKDLVELSQLFVTSANLTRPYRNASVVMDETLRIFRQALGVVLSRFA